MSVVCKSDYEIMMYKVSEIYEISKELKNIFGEGRFSIDGLLMGDVGEFTASYYYGIDLYQNGQKRHDGEVDGRKVQIKVSQII